MGPFSGDAQQYNVLSKAGKVTYASLPGYELMGKPISSSSDTDFAKFIKALKATDWVRSGHTHFAGQTDGKCPYCQQKLPSNFDKEIAARLMHSIKMTSLRLMLFKEHMNQRWIPL